MKIDKNGWSFLKLKEASIYQRGVTYSKKDEAEISGIGILRANNISLENKFVFENIRYISSDFNVKKSQKLIAGDILICVASGSIEHVGKIAFFDHDSDFYAGGFMGIIRPLENVVFPKFLYYILSTNTFIRYVQKQRAGTNIQNLKFSEIENYLLSLPPLKEQKQIANLFQNIETTIEQLDNQEENLKYLKKTLLNNLFGKKSQFGKYFSGSDFEDIQFEDVAFHISERIEPKQTDLEIYVGLEHLEPDNLVIERTGKPEDVIGTKMKIYKGDIIFGKRRAYQRKLAVSHFDGIASAHSMILRANEKRIEKDFLPYFMQSDVFMERAVKISEGSLSPTIKWKTLAVQKFSIPKKRKQVQLVELLRQFDTILQLIKNQKTTLKTLKQHLLNEILGS